MADRPAEELVIEAIKILQRNLEPGGMSDRETISQLWGVLDSPEASALYCEKHPEHCQPEEAASNHAVSA